MQGYCIYASRDPYGDCTFDSLDFRYRKLCYGVFVYFCFLAYGFSSDRNWNVLFLAYGERDNFCRFVIGGFDFLFPCRRNCIYDSKFSSASFACFSALAVIAALICYMMTENPTISGVLFAVIEHCSFSRISDQCFAF